MKRIILYALALLLVLPSSIFSRDNDNKKNRKKALITNGELHANNVKGLIANNGWLFWGGGASGFVIPSPVFSNNTGNFATVFASGLWLSGTVNGEFRSAVAVYSTDFYPGLWDEYTQDPVTYNQQNQKYRVYYKYSQEHIDYLTQLYAADDATSDQRVKGFAESELQKANDENALWPQAVLQGAAENPPGDVVAFTVYHDADVPTREENGVSELPMNVQVRMTAFAFRASNAINNSVFINMEFINKNAVAIENLFATVWSDPDVGQYDDDLVGSNRALGLGYAYNGTESDAQYTDILGLNPPAVGYDYFQGPIIDSVGVNVIARYEREGGFRVYINEADAIPNAITTDTLILNKYVRPTTGFFYYNNGDDPGNPAEFYFFANNRLKNGDQSAYQIAAVADGRTSAEDQEFFFNGDPESNSGWLDANPSDRRFILNNGPFTLGVSDGTQKFGDPGYNSVVFGVFSSFGNDNLNSVTQLIEDDKIIQLTFDNAFYVRADAPAPIVTARSTSKQIVLNWQPGSRLIGEKRVKITTEDYGLLSYEFDAYEVVQFESTSKANSNNPNDYKVVATIPVTNIKRSITITTDLYNSGKPLYNNNFYSYGVRGVYKQQIVGSPLAKFVYSIWSSSISQLSPRNIDGGTVITSTSGTVIPLDSANSIFNGSQGNAIVTVFDPYITTGDAYTVHFDTIRENKYMTGYPGDTIHASDHVLGWYVMHNGVSVTDTVPQGLVGTEFGYDRYVDGLNIAVVGPPDGLIDFYVRANAAGAVDPPAGASPEYNGFPGLGRTNIASQQSTNTSQWFVHTGEGNGATFDDFLRRSIRNGYNDIVPYEFELRFTNDADNYAYNGFGGTPNAGTAGSVPFEIWNATLGVRMIPYIIDWDGDGWNLQQWDHEASGSDNDPVTDWIYWYLPLDMSAGEAGYQAAFAGGTYNSGHRGNEVFARIVLVGFNNGSVSDPTYPANLKAVMPEAGTIFVIKSEYRKNQPNTVFAFNGPGDPIINDPGLQAKNFADEVTVFPNPYYGYHAQQNAKDGAFVTFANLPDNFNTNNKVEIIIYSVSGQKVKTLSYENSSSKTIKWFLTNDEEVKVASGVYVAVLKFRSKSKIMKLLIFQGEQRLKTF